MKLRLLTLFGLCLAGGLHAQAPDDAASPKRSPEELNELLGPVALYPDPLISLLLPASTVPSDIVLADRFVASGGDPDAVEEKSWDSSVKALTRYPDTLKWLDDNLDWTSQVGDAFTEQPVEVMEAIQALRAKAKAMGNLVDSPEENVIEDDNNIRIVPAQPDSIYVPSYDPEVVYERRAERPQVYFSEPYAVGPWLGYDFDWHRHHLYRGEWHRGWDYGRDRERDGDRRDRSRDVYVNRSLSNTEVWHVDHKRRQTEVRRPATNRVVTEKGHINIPHPKPIVIGAHKGESIRRGESVRDPKTAPLPFVRGTTESSHMEKGGKGHVALPNTTAPGLTGEALKPKGGSFKPHSDSFKNKGEGAKPHTEVLKPKGEGFTPNAEGFKPKGEGAKPHTEVLKPKGEGFTPNAEGFKPKGEGAKPHTEVLKPKGEGAKPHTEVLKPKGEEGRPHIEGGGKPKGEGFKAQHADTPKPRVEAHKETPKAEMHKEAPKPRVEAHKEAPKPRVEAHREAPKPKVEAHKEAPKAAPSKPHSEGSKDGKKKDKKDT